MNALTAAIAEYGAWALAFTALGFFVGGFVKGAVGFALPMVAIACAATVLPKEAAVAYLAIPILVTNVWQAIRQGSAAAWKTLVSLRLMIALMMVSLLAATQLLPTLDAQTFSAILGVVAVSYAVLQLAGWRPVIQRPLGDVVFGLAAGIVGGLSGVWGTPALMMLLMLNLSKQEIVRACGVVFTLGCIPFIIGHAITGVLNSQTVVVSAALLIPTAIGMWLGQQIQDRLDADVLKRGMLIVLLIAGANFVGRAIFGG